MENNDLKEIVRQNFSKNNFIFNGRKSMWKIATTKQQ
jgi:hypothetical protein